MKVGELRKALEGVADDVPVVAIPKGGQQLTDRIPTNHAFCVGDRTDSYVGAFAIEIAQTIVGAAELVYVPLKPIPLSEYDPSKDSGNAVCLCDTPMGFSSRMCSFCGGLIQEDRP